jgi:hypothetical protein
LPSAGRTPSPTRRWIATVWRCGVFATATVAKPVQPQLMDCRRSTRFCSAHAGFNIRVMALSPPAAASTGGPRQVCNPVEALAGRDVASAKPRNPACSSRQTKAGARAGVAAISTNFPLQGRGPAGPAGHDQPGAACVGLLAAGSRRFGGGSGALSAVHGNVRCCAVRAARDKSLMSPSSSAVGGD